MKSASQIRTEFLKFFQDKGHTIVPSAPVIVQDDPTLYFTNAGMNQFKDVFLGTGQRPYTRAVDTQKCIRVSGKHNDLEEVGRDTYHHTFFEMLGNWSFGDYFKKEAIAWAWELLTEVWQIPAQQLWATVFGGCAEEGLEPDEEAATLWAQLTSLPAERILRFGKKDNFWEMGETGPCGPCSEIHIDLGPAACDRQQQPGHRCAVNGDCGRFIEIWNLVFMQFNRLEDKTLKPLPARHVDTGMGFERLVALIQGKRSNYDIDVFAPIIKHISQIAGTRYESGDAQVDVASRVVADHVRALCSAFADGALPGRDGRGYVLRRILRRAVRFGRQTLKIDHPFIYQLVPTVAEIYQDVFPEIAQRREHIALLIRSEEESFARTLDRGLVLFDQLVNQLRQKNQDTIPGDQAYELYQRDGFPKDLVELMAREQGLHLDQEGWNQAALHHKERSQGAKGFTAEFDLSTLEGLPATVFLGYEQLTAPAKILKLIDTERIVLDQTPFYAEAGGQVGDQGLLTADNFCFRVEDTRKYGDVIVHIGELQQGDIAHLPAQVKAAVDESRRAAIRSNHTATHLLHWALRQVLGTHVTQQGSLVAPDYLRFDFSHPQAMTREQLDQVERLINQQIVANVPVTTTVEDLKTAKAQGAMALFGEKYGQQVRVVRTGDFSVELCGGTHVQATGEIGCCLITAERSPQAGMRRIEALTRQRAITYFQEQRQLLYSAAAQIKANHPTQLLKRITELQAQVKELKQTASRKSQRNVHQQAQELLQQAKTFGETKVLAAIVQNVNPKELGNLADALRKSQACIAGVLLASAKGKVQVVAFVSADLTDKLHAGKLVSQVAKVVGGGGGGRNPQFATGGGSKPDAMSAAVDMAQTYIQEQIQAG